MRSALVLALAVACVAPVFAQTHDWVIGQPINDRPAPADPRIATLFKEMETMPPASSKHSFKVNYMGLTEFPGWLTWKDIPVLMARSRDTTPLKRHLTNPLSSYMMTSPCSEGMIAMWLIEGIRKGYKFPSLNPMALPSNPPSGRYEHASEMNHKAVADAYAAWWEKAKTMPAAEAVKIDPLAGVGLHWY